MRFSFYILFSLVFAFANQSLNGQTKTNSDSVLLVNKMIKAIQEKDVAKVGEELYRLKNGTIKIEPQYLHFFTAMQNLVSFQRMDSASIGPVVLIDSAVFHFNKALESTTFKSFTELEIQNPEMGIQYCVDKMNFRGKSYFEMNELIKSIESYEKGLSIRKNLISATGAGLSCMKKEYYQLSVKYFKTALEINPKSLNSFILLTEAYMKDNKTDSAKRLIDGVFPIFKDSLTFLTQAYNVYNKLNDTNNCIVILTKISEIEPSKSEVFFNLGVMYEKKGNIKLSEKNYKSALKLSPNEFKINFNLAVLFFNRYAQLSNDIALKQNLEHYTIDEKKLERITWIDKAKPYVDFCLKIQPNNTKILTILYHYYLTNEQSDNAQKTLNRINELNKK